MQLKNAMHFLPGELDAASLHTFTRRVDAFSHKAKQLFTTFDFAAFVLSARWAEAGDALDYGIKHG